MKAFKVAWLSFKRYILRSVLLVFVLMVSFSFLNIGLYQYRVSKENIDYLKKEYVTAVELDDSRIQRVYRVGSGNEDEEFEKQEQQRKKYKEQYGKESPMTLRSKECLGYIEGLEEKLDEFHKNSPDVLLYDKKVCALAWSSDVSPVKKINTIKDNIFYFDCKQKSEGWEIVNGKRVHVSRRDSEYYDDGQLFQGIVSTPIVDGFLCAKCVKTEIYEPPVLEKDSMDREYRRELRRTLGEKSEFCDLNGRLTTVGYFEIMPEYSDILPEFNEVKYLQVATNSALASGELLFEEGKAYLLPIYNGYLYFENLADLVTEKDDDPLDWKNLSFFPYELVSEEKPCWCMYGYDLFNKCDFSDDINDVIEKNYIDAVAVEKIKEKYALKNDFKVREYLEGQYAEVDLDNPKDIAQKKEELKDIAEYIHILSNEMPVVVTNSIDLVPDIQKKYLKILERKDNLKGRQVFVSSEFADFNHLEVGDEIHLKMVIAGFGICSVEKNDTISKFRYRIPDLKLKELEIASGSSEDKYVIAGIYDFHKDYDYLTAKSDWGREKANRDTVFLVGNPEEYFSDLMAGREEEINQLFRSFSRSISQRGMLSVQLKNGKEHIENYQKEMKEAGLDQYIKRITDAEGFSRVEAKIEDMDKENKKNIMLAMTVGALMLAVFYALSLFLMRVDKKKMALLGTSRKFKIGYVSGLEMIYLLVGFLLSYPISIKIGNKMMTEDVNKILSMGEGQNIVGAGDSSMYLLPFYALCGAILLSLVLSVLSSAKKSKVMS